MQVSADAYLFAMQQLFTVGAGGLALAIAAKRWIDRGPF